MWSLLTGSTVQCIMINNTMETGALRVPHVLCIGIIVLANLHISVADYDCVCNYDVEAPVMSQDTGSGTAIGYMYEFDCKQALQLPVQTGWYAIAQAHQVAYVKASDNMTPQLCEGNPPAEDVLTSSSAQSSTTHTMTYTMGSNIITMLSSSSPKPISTHSLPDVTYTSTETSQSTTQPTSSQASSTLSQLFTSRAGDTSTFRTTTQDTYTDKNAASKSTVQKQTTAMSNIVSFSTRSALISSNTDSISPTERFTSSKPNTKTTQNSNYSQHTILTKIISSPSQSSNYTSVGHTSSTERPSSYSQNWNTNQFKSTLHKDSSSTSAQLPGKTSESLYYSTTYKASSTSVLPPVSNYSSSRVHSTRVTESTVAGHNTSIVASTHSPVTNGTEKSEISGRVDLCPYHVLATTNYSKGSGYFYMRQIGNYCYELRPRLADWSSARRDCVSRSGDLVVVSNPAVQSAVLELLARLDYQYKVWIGLYDVGKTGTWAWVDGEHLTDTGYSNWQTGRTDSVYGTRQECVTMGGAEGAWRETVCSGFLLDIQRHPWVCQYKWT